MRLIFLLCFLLSAQFVSAQTFWQPESDSTQHSVDSLVEDVITSYYEKTYFNTERNSRLISKGDLHCLKDSFNRKENSENKVSFSWYNKNEEAILTVSMHRKYYFDIDNELGKELLLVLEETTNSCGFSFKQHRIWRLN
jgi:hypothetical protein